MLDSEDEFYVGYAAAPPAGVARLVRRAVLALVVLAALVPLVLVAAQQAFAPAAFEFGQVRSFRGTIHEQPVPVLAIERPGVTPGGIPAVSVFPLVAEGKHGAQEIVRGLDARSVELSGSLIYRDGQTMIEVATGSVVADAAGGSVSSEIRVEDLGAVRLRGEIVDTKCHFGVMNPGDGKPHRQCAARCIAGGIPPALRAREASGESRYFLLLGREGQTINHDVLPFVAEPVEIDGRAERRGDQLVLYADPSAIRRVGEEG